MHLGPIGGFVYFAAVLPTVFCGDPASYKYVSLSDLNLNRVGEALTSTLLNKLPNAEFGFSWNSGDQSTTDWRPQGLTSVAYSSGAEMIAVSWYSRSDETVNAGSRISFVNVSNDKSDTTFDYRHVLLVDENYNTFSGMHAGGLAYYKGLIHVPDSRSGTKKVYTFSTKSIQAVPSEDQNRFYNYGYILARSGSYDVPITPSFLSFDWNREQILLGTFYQCSSVHQDTPDCLSNSNNRLTWYTVGTASGSTPYCSPFFSEMQGAVADVLPLASAGSRPSSSNNSNSSISSSGGGEVLWTVSSYGSGNPSHLHIASLNLETSDTCSGTTDLAKTYRVVEYPPGLEDMHIPERSSAFADYVWMLTEFGSGDGTGNVRTVFATKKTDIAP
jgi:hypothetical protein